MLTTCTGRTVVWTSRLKEQVVLAVTSLFVHCPNKQINNCFTLSATHAEPSAVKGAPIFYHCVALVVVTIYTNIQILVGWLFFGFEEV